MITAFTPAVKRQIYWVAAILATVACAIGATIYSLTHGVYEVFPFLYFLPIILFVYLYPKRGVLFTLILSSIFLILIYLFGNFNSVLIAVSTAWFVIFVTIGVVTSSFAEGLRDEEKKYRGIFENSQAGIFTFDIQSLQIREINGKCAQMLNYDRGDLIDADLSKILMESSDRNIFLKNIREHIQTGDVELLFHTQDSGVRQFLVSASLTASNLVICSAIDITERKLAEQVIAKAREDLEQRVKERTEELMRANEVLKSEIYERKRFEAAIQLANRKLNTLSTITRHDILNQITAIVMYLSLAEESSSDPGVIDQLHKIEEITQLIQKQIRFTRDYQTIGESTPHWQDIGITVDNALAGLDMGAIKVEKGCKNLELFADYLLEKVFYNILDNSVRHGEKVTTVRFSCRENTNGITIIIEDDGVGIPDGVKEKIFKREYYRNTGYGLFLAEEILSITGITISETGVPGKGARFEIHAPKGTYRYGEPGTKA